MGTVIAPPVQVAVRDRFGNLASAPVTVVLVLQANPAGGTLSGSTAATAAGGLAVFADLAPWPGLTLWDSALRD